MTNLIGRRIVATRTMLKSECEAEGWDQPTTALILDDGTVLYPSRDEEGNGPGALFGFDSSGHGFSVVDR